MENSSRQETVARKGGKPGLNTNPKNGLTEVQGDSDGTRNSETAQRAATNRTRRRIRGLDQARAGGDSVLRWTIQSRSRETRRTRTLSQTIVHAARRDFLGRSNSYRCARVACLL